MGNIDFKIIITELSAIIVDVNSNKTENALELFKEHIHKVINIGRYKQETWDYQWRELVYKFGESFQDKDPVDFLKVITQEKHKCDEKDEREVLDFYYSEIHANTLNNSFCTEYFEHLIKEYPYNPEFRHSLGHYYSNNDKYEEAFENYLFSYEKDKECNTFELNLVNFGKTYANILISKGEYQKAQQILNTILNHKELDSEFNNVLIIIKERIKDYIDLNNKISQAEQNIIAKYKEVMQKEQFKTIEILSIFTAIVAFIFSTVSISQSFSLDEALIFIISLGLVLILFIDVTHLFFSYKKPTSFLDYRILLMIILVTSLFVIISKFDVLFWLN